MNPQTLQQTIHDTIPISKHMGFTISSLSGQQIKVTAPLPNNINIHGTAFAGSIYTIATLTAWGLAYSILQDNNIEADLVLGEAHIKYRTPIKNDLLCMANINDENHKAFINKLNQKARGRLQIIVNINDAAQWEGKLIAIPH
ncbi:MAG: YiiD C-terminal domain-containing protein [Thiolinea sp.]